MLVLSRKAGQVIRVSDDIAITVISAREGSARLGIEAPREMVIDRQEVFEAKQKGRANAGENGEMVGG